MRLLHLALLGIEPGSLGLEPYFTMSARQGGSSFEVSVNHFAASSFSSGPVFLPALCTTGLLYPVPLVGQGHLM